MTAGTALFTPMAMLQVSGKLERQEKPWIGSGLCMNCYRAKERKELEEQELIKEAQLRQAKDILETPLTWDCPYCKAINRGNFCSNCGAPRKKQKSREASLDNTRDKIPTESSKQETESKPEVESKSKDKSEPEWYQEALRQHNI